MLQRIIKFTSVKLIILFIVTAILTLCSLGLKNILGTFEIETLTAEQNLTLTKGLLAAILSVIFFAYVFFITYKMKHMSDGDKKAVSIVKFSLKETAVYAIYLTILLAVALIVGEQNIANTFAVHILNPQIPLFQFGLNLYLNFTLMSIVYFVISTIARKIGTNSNKTKT